MAEPQSGGGSSASPAAATVSHRVSEADLTTVTLTPEAVGRLAIKTVAAREGTIGRARLFGGEAVVPAGRTIQLAAPFAGTISAAGRAAPAPGTAVKKGEAVLRLQPIVMGDREVLTPTERISLARAAADFDSARAQADGDVSAARVQLDLARVKLDRAKRLREQDLTSQKALDEATAEYELSEARLEAAEAKMLAWKEAARGMHADQQAALDLVAPFDGVLADVSVAPGEAVNAGAPVARFVSVDPLWVRVPVYVGALEQLNTDAAARIAPLDARPRPDAEVVQRIAGMPTADPLASSVDLFYRLPNGAGKYRPMQRVGVWVPSNERQTGLIVPWSAILYDIHGGTWVYEQTQPLQFVRRRVEVAAVEGDAALASRGLRAGMKVVTDGAAELFGVEFGAGK